MYVITLNYIKTIVSTPSYEGIGNGTETCEILRKKCLRLGTFVHFLPQ